jgi:hypothetical protein
MYLRVHSTYIPSRFLNFFAIFSKMKRARYNFFSSKKRRLREESNCARFIAICCLIREPWPFTFFSQAKILNNDDFFREIFVANLSQIGINL